MPNPNLGLLIFPDLEVQERRQEAMRLMIRYPLPVTIVGLLSKRSPFD